MSMYFGATTWPFKWAPPYEEAILRVAKLGFKSTELTVWDTKYIEEYYTPTKNRELAQMIKDKGMVLSEIFFVIPGMGSEDATVRAKAVQEFQRVLDVAEQLGTQIVNTCTAYPFDIEFPLIFDKPLKQEWQVDLPGDRDWKKNYFDQIDVLRQFAQSCEKRNMRFVLEPHPWRLMHNAAGMLRIIDHVQSPAIGMNCDPSHLFPMGEIPHQVVYEVGDRIFHVHCSDNDGQTNVHWRPGKGNVDWVAFVKALDDIGYNGPLSIELEDVPGAAGYPGIGRIPTSSDMIDREYAKAKDFLARCCEEAGVKIDS